MTPPATREVPKIDIILLGSPGVGKATFLSRLPHVKPPRRQRPNQPESQSPVYQGPGATPSTSQTTLAESTGINERQSTSNDSRATLVPSQHTSLASNHPPHLAPTPTTTPQESHIPPPLTGPLTFKVSLFARPYAITIHPSTSQLFTDPFPASPDLLILTFAIPSRASLHNLLHYWMPQYHLHYPTSTIPILLLGLQRDLRTSKTTTRQATSSDTGTTPGEVIEEYECVMPEEGVQAAREMRLDRYAECSALTGELMWEATQDLTKMAAQTTVDRDEDGSRGDEGAEGCVVM